ncbi:hypothetical protein FCR2A7T_23800 [Flavobacterium cauense R2A-7]|uniref:Putative membrane protein n=1 Tax=Flavobacterium cauense R2A-7 TaxID=1341154 RepID=V6RWW9_9FLAO|nr:TMEM175 family protein [Flavobacterium cauense]ESU18973.1 hypothetical protein FCR2A7T_23800 [Flavobacterium cauense R2A-7]KGO82395.1 hypothetical protein Q762_06915 [Flavobacterium cauense R2A-7]TWI15369.1 putative membrane protein [Flavobacterium cauense R2A-7]
MTKTRLEAFSDGVIAIIITIMVIEFKTPGNSSFEELCKLIPKFIIYLLSFVYLGIYWINHHHLIHNINKINGKILWANLHLLFWLSFFPLATSYVGEYHFKEIPTAFYGFVLLMASVSWSILVITLNNSTKKEGEKILHEKLNFKSYLSIFLYFIGFLLSFIAPVIASGIYVILAVIWFRPNE